MKNFNTKEIVVDVVMEVLVRQRFEVPLDYEFGDYETQYQDVTQTSYLKLLNEYGADMPNLSQVRNLKGIDGWEVLNVSFQGIDDVNVYECDDTELCIKFFK
jgi:hypothetical protein